MNTERIALKKGELRDKTQALNDIAEKLENEIQISSLPFGEKNTGQSQCASSRQMEALNAEYALTVASLAALVRATALFLKNTQNRFEKVDGAPVAE